MRYSELKKQIRSGGGALKPAYLVYGQDDYLKSEALKLFKSLVDGDFKDFNLTVIEDDIDAALAETNALPMLADFKVIVLTLSSKASEEGVAKLKNYLVTPVDTAILVVSCDSDIAKSLKIRGIESVICSDVTDEEIKEEVVSLLAPTHVMTDEALGELIIRTRRSFARIVSETNKLKSYSSGIISKKDVEDMVAADIEYQVFRLTEAVCSKSANQSLEILTALLDSGIKPKVIVDSLYERYRRILHVSLNKSAPNEYFAEQFYISAPAVYYIKRAAENYSQVQLKNICDYLHSLQCDILMGKRSDESAMHEAILQLICA